MQYCSGSLGGLQLFPALVSQYIGVLLLIATFCSGTVFRVWACLLAQSLLSAGLVSFLASGVVYATVRANLGLAAYLCLYGRCHLLQSVCTCWVCEALSLFGRHQLGFVDYWLCQTITKSLGIVSPSFRNLFCVTTCRFSPLERHKQRKCGDGNI